LSERDPIKSMAAWLIGQSFADKVLLDRIYSEIQSEIEKAVEFALAAPYPSVDEVEQNVYA
jgi:TPP-dependent pyruvate/acetoin dehydrogenase alpha subunit